MADVPSPKPLQGVQLCTPQVEILCAEWPSDITKGQQTSVVQVANPDKVLEIIGFRAFDLPVLFSWALVFVSVERNHWACQSFD